MSNFKTLITINYCSKFFLFLFVFFSQILWAQSDVKFRLICEVKEVTIGEQFQVAFRLEGARIVELTLPSFDKFEAMGPSSSVSNSYINGRSFQVESKIYVLSASKAGKYTIGAATVKTNTGQTFKTEPLTITVVTKNNNSSNNSISKSQGAPDISNNIFLELKASNEHPVIGEQVVLDWIIYTRMDIAQINLVKLPKASAGFVHNIEDIDQANKYNTINGKEYISRILHRSIIFPDKAGDITISDGVINIGLLDDLNNLHNLFSPFSNTHNYRLSSKPLTLKVKELSANAPDDFNGVVGDYIMTAQVDQNTITSDDMLRLTIQIRGAGDLKQISPPSLNFADGAYEVFPPNIKEEFLSNSSALGGAKTFEYMLTPLKVGNYPITPTFSFYNTQIQDFQTQKIDLNINILKGKNPLRTLSKITTTTEDSIDAANTEILELTEPFNVANFSTYRDWYFLKWWTAIGILLIPIVAYIIKERKNTPNNNSIVQKPITEKELKKAVQFNANQQLQKALFLMKKGEAQAFYTEIAQALKVFIAHKTELPFQNLNKQSMRDALDKKGVNITTIQEIDKTLNTCDMALYSGLGTSEDMEKIYQASNNIISALNKQIA